MSGWERDLGPEERLVASRVRLSRRDLLQRGALMALTLPALRALVGCGGSSVASGDVSILVGMGPGNTPAQIPVQEQIAKSLQNSGGVKNVSFLRAQSGASTKLQTSLAAKNPPQMSMPTSYISANSFVDKGVWENLLPRISAESIDLDGLFLPPAVAAVRNAPYYGPQSQHVMGLPLVLSGTFMGVNTDLFAKAGIPPPAYGWNDPAWNYDKMLELAQATTLDSKGRNAGQSDFDVNGATQFGLATFSSASSTRGFGGTFYIRATNSLGIATPDYEAGLQFAADLKNKYHVVPTAEQAAVVGGSTSNQSQDATLQAWLSGKVAMAPLSLTNLATYGAVKNFQWMLAPMPTGPKRLFSALDVVMGNIVAGSASDPNVDEAWTVMKGFLIDPANAQKFASSLQGYPAMQQNAEGFVEATTNTYPNVDPQVVVGSITHGSTDVAEWYPAYNEVNAAVQPYVDRVIAGQGTAVDQMPPAQAAGQKAIDEWLKSNALPTS